MKSGVASAGGVAQKPGRSWRRSIQAVRRPVVLMADALAGRSLDVDRTVLPVKDACPAAFRSLRDDYLSWCRQRANAAATRVTIAWGEKKTIDVRVTEIR